MKPIKLTVKGLNSFIEEQTIDFNKLTDRGLFGIFGPTGSGKSTVLDGITLALYGDVARKSSNFINTNCSDLSVSYTFQISGNPSKQYRVNRQFRRDKKTGNAKTHATSIREVTLDGEIILAESVTSVNKACREILGLSLEDFTRTVVLPQGKFSEFLKLEGKQRREMLERLFNLQQYGEHLTSKLSRQKVLQEEQKNKLLGELGTYDEVSEDELVTRNESLETMTYHLESLRKQQIQVEACYKEGEEVWSLQRELLEHQQNQQNLVGLAERMRLEGERLSRGERALKIQPYKTQCESVKVNLANQENVRQGLDEQTARLNNKKIELDEAFTKVRNSKETVLPEMKLQLQQVRDLEIENQELLVLEGSVPGENGKKSGLYQVVTALRRVYAEVDKCQVEDAGYNVKITRLQAQMMETRKQEETVRIDSEVRRQVNEGIRLAERQAFQLKSYTKGIEKQQELASLEKQYKEQADQLNEKLSQRKGVLESLVKQQETLLIHAPMTQEALLDKQSELIGAREKYQRLVSRRQEIKVVQLECQVEEEKQQQLEALIQHQNVQLKVVKDELEHFRLENLAHTLREHLKEGEACPVCGSTHYLLDGEQVHKVSREMLAIKEAEWEKIEETLAGEQDKLVALKVKVAAYKDTLKRLEKEQEELEEVFKEQSIEQLEETFEKLSTCLKSYDEQKRQLEEQLVREREVVNETHTQLKYYQSLMLENEKQREGGQKELGELKVQLTQVEGEIEAVGKVLKTEDFTTCYEEVKAKDKEREHLLTLLEQLTKEMDEQIQKREKNVKAYHEAKATFQRGVARYDEMQRKKIERLQKMKQRLISLGHVTEDYPQTVQETIHEMTSYVWGSPILSEQLEGDKYGAAILQSEDEEMSEMGITSVESSWSRYPLVGIELLKLKELIEKLDKVLVEALIKIETTYNEVEERKKKLDQDYEESQKGLIEATSQSQALCKQLEEASCLLEAQLEEENLTLEEVGQYLLTKEQIEALRNNLEQYREDCAKMAGKIEEAKNKLGERVIDEETWCKLVEEREKIGEQVLEVTRQHTNQMTLVKQMEEALARLGKLREEKEKIDHQMAMLSDLDKLFKGKRFVEFVAIERLKYVSMEASKRLKEITNGNYGLEVDEDGKFIIRDFKNGGSERDTSTLSGGETFLASLALALALSAEIQLKGTAPLELFFLDEGFGTLDDELLEVVMGSLERLHHDKLKVGIISHVESIKNRVPVKLLLTPAKAGCGGTKVRLERS